MKAYDWFNWIPEEEMIAWRRHIHQNPEPSFEEVKTASFVRERLSEIEGMKIERPTETSILATLEGNGPGKTFLLRGDMDALPVEEQNDIPFKSQVPGVSHMCGHDAHTAMLLASAKVLSKMTSRFKGRVQFLFQHAEERHPGGAQEVVNSGLLKDIDGILALHVFSNLKAGSVNVTPGGPATAGQDTMKLTIHGKGSHGSMPQLGIDPVVVGAQIVLALQTVVSRSCPPDELAVVTVAEFHAGKQYNIIPDSAYLTANIRTANPEVRALIEKRIRDIVQGVCDAYGATPQMEYIKSYPAVINDPDLAKLMKASAKEVLGDDMVFDIKMSTASEDFSYYQELAPVLFVQLGGGTEAEGCGEVNHNPKFMLREEALTMGVKVEVQTALNFLK